MSRYNTMNKRACGECCYLSDARRLDGYHRSGDREYWCLRKQKWCFKWSSADDCDGFKGRLHDAT
jgi:hypothetical protein